MSNLILIIVILFVGWVNTLKSDLGRPPIRPHFSYSSQAEALLSTCCTKALTMKTNQACNNSLSSLHNLLRDRRFKRPPDKDGRRKIGSVGWYLEIPVTFEANILAPYNQGLYQRRRQRRPQLQLLVGVFGLLRYLFLLLFMFCTRNI